MFFNSPVSFILFWLILLSSCSGPIEKSRVAAISQEKKSAKMNVEVLSSIPASGITISGIQADTLSPIEGIRGITLSFDVKVTPEAFQVLKADRYTSYFIDVRCSTPEGRSFLYRDELFKSPDKKKFININRDCFISQPTQRHIEIPFPYRFLEMTPGEKELTLEIHAFPTRFTDDSTSLHMRMIKQISAESKGNVAVKLKVQAPPLYTTMFTVHQASINTGMKRADKYDIAVTGPGYPDLFWEVFCGNDYIYYSPVEKNKTAYTKKCSSPSFYVSGDDTVHLLLVDYDNGPFNTQDDIVGSWEVKVSDLVSGKIDTISFGKVESMILEAKVEAALNTSPGRKRRNK